MEDNRKAFGRIPNQDNALAMCNGKDIFMQLKERFNEDSVVDYDMIMNTLCVSLICLIRATCRKDDYPYIVQIIHQILSKNLE